MRDEKKYSHGVRQGLAEVYPRLWRYCLVLTRSRSAADDLAQQASLQGLAQAAHFTPGTHLDRWLFTIARRTWLNELRSIKVRTGAGAVPARDANLVDEKPDPEMNILAREVFDMVQALPDGQSLAVLLVYVEGYSYREAAEAMDVPIGTVMSRLAAARRRVAEQAAEPMATVEVKQ